jgi:hypothetical protein
MLDAAANVVVIAFIVVTITVAVVIIPVAVVVLAFVLHHPLVLLLHRLVVACCFASVAGIFAACPSFGWLLRLLCIVVVVRQMTMLNYLKASNLRLA